MDYQMRSYPWTGIWSARKCCVGIAAEHTVTLNNSKKRPVISALEGLRQEDYLEFKADLGYNKILSQKNKTSPTTAKVVPRQRCELAPSCMCQALVHTRNVRWFWLCGRMPCGLRVSMVGLKMVNFSLWAYEMAQEVKAFAAQV